MSHAAAEARKAFGIRLRDLRRDAGLTGRQLAGTSGIHNTKISRIEHGLQSPSEDDIRAWCIACGVARRIDELIAVHREIEQMWTEYRHELRKGQKHIQARGESVYARTKLLRAYEAIVIPGILQTRDYVRSVLTINAHVHGLPVDDVDAAADARLSRQHLLTHGSGENTYSFVIEASVLSYWFGGVEVMLEQLEFLESTMSRPNVAIGVIPPGPRRIWGGECFYIFDKSMVRSEMWTGAFRTTRPDEINFFLKVFELLRSQAVYGEDARNLIDRERTRLQTAENL